jgi:two-component system response regulator NreC
LDIAMPGTDGTQAIQEIKRRFPHVKILVLTTHKSEDYVLEAFQSGADGYCLKDVTYAGLLAAIESVLAGRSYVSPGISENILEGYSRERKSLKHASRWDALTQREKTVLKLISEGHTNKKIADYLNISVKTVDKHRSNLMKKLDLHNASALTAYAIERGLLPQ